MKSTGRQVTGNNEDGFLTRNNATERKQECFKYKNPKKFQNRNFIPSKTV